MSEAENTPEIKQHKISRRNFLKGATLAGASLILGRSESSEAPRSPEQTKPPSIAILDIFGINQFKEKALAKYFQNKEFNESEILKSAGVTDTSNLEGLKVGVPQTDEETFVFMMKALELYWGKHGEGVVETRRKVQEYLGNSEKKITTDSIGNAVRFLDLERDEINNPTIWLEVSPRVIENKINSMAEEVVNMSFEVGRVGFKYELYYSEPKYPDIKMPGSRKVGDGPWTYTDYYGNEITKEQYDEIIARSREVDIVLKDPKYRRFWPQDAYYGEYTEQNLAYVARIARKYPEKIFIGAAGNPSDYSLSARSDISEARAKLAQQKEWPDNLLMIGVYGEENGKTAPVAIGADFYVWQHDLTDEIGAEPTASYATAFVTEVVTELRSQGKKPDEIRQALIELSNNKSLYEEEFIWVLGLDKIKKELVSPVG